MGGGNRREGQEHEQWKKEARLQEALPTAPCRAMSVERGLGMSGETQSQSSGTPSWSWGGGRGEEPASVGTFGLFVGPHPLPHSLPLNPTMTIFLSPQGWLHQTRSLLLTF